MQIHQFSLSKLLIKAAVFVSFFYVIFLTLSILITGYLFFSLDSYKTRIEKVVYKHTGYKLSVESIKTKLNSYYLPEIIIKNARLQNPSDLSQSFAVKSLEFVFSYSSIWNLEPIFNEINIDGTNADIQYLTDGSILINGINLNHPDQKTIENTKNSPIDLENWILKQKSIKLSNINFSFDDKHNNFPILRLKNITTTLINGYRKTHSFDLRLDTATGDGSSVIAKLDWTGGKVTEFRKWQNAELKLQSYSGKDNVTKTLKKYLPGINLLQGFNAETEFDAQIEDNKLQYFYANFDLKNLQYILKNNAGLIEFPKLGGSIKITLNNNSAYSLNATNLTIATPDGYILNKRNISGQYSTIAGGNINLESTELKAFNNILPLFASTHGISMDGTIEVTKLSWAGTIFKPTNFELFAKFHNIGIVSKAANIPSINGISGDIRVAKDHGTLNLLLENSTLNYSKIFLIPYRFKHLDTHITWAESTPANSTESSNNWVVNLGKTNLEMADFSGTVSGQYIYIPGTSGYLSLKAHVDKVLTAKVGDYLPKQIEMSVHKWLNEGLISGYGANADLDLQGPLNKFPFEESGTGRFYIDADIQNAKLLYDKNWATLDNLYGKFKIRNVAIIIEANSGKVNGNNINKALVTIPNMTASKVELIADGVASGLTSNFMGYLQQTPVNAIIGNIPDKVSATGNGIVNLHLKVPFSDPNKTIVDGNYEFKSNSLKFDMPVPPLSNVYGKLFFTEHGMQIDSLTALTLGSTVNAKANTDKAGTIHFAINSPNLDYAKFSEFYLPFLSSIFSGHANTQVSFDIGKHGINNINSHSNLAGVRVSAPKPLYKDPASINPVNFIMLNNNKGFNVQFNYANMVAGKVMLDEHGNLGKTDLTVGSADFLSNTSNNPKIIVNGNIHDTYVLDWLDTIIKLTTKNSKSQSKVAASGKPAGSNTRKPSDSNSFFPLELWLDTSHFFFGKTDYRKVNLDVLVSKTDAIFVINNARANGYGKFNFAKDELNLMINDFHYSQAVIDLTDKESVPFAIKINNAQAAKPTLKTNDQIKVAFNNVKSQKESADANVKLPLTHILIKNFWFENQLFGSFSLTLRPHGKDLIVENGLLRSKISDVTFNGVNYCMECGLNRSFVDMQTKTDIKDLGSLLNSLGYKDTVSGGKGVASASIQWNGRLDDFDITRTIATIAVEIKNGKFLKIDTSSSILNQLIGIINLQYIFNFANGNLGGALQNGFFFNKLTMHAYLMNSKLTIKDLDILSASLTVSSHGIIDVQNDTIDMHMSVTPHLSAGVAVAAGVVTLQPWIGAAVYGGELLLGSPINKLFTVSFRIRGSLSNPVIEQIGVTKQVVKNVNSTVKVGGKSGS
ncbi:MAG: hypothetical protein K0R14_76 [Burkholderiales bacterium]|jgi:uncharacterized protein (TIGR02099 family)|nr:hypothetical protein [Burkholderiales bacterium]